MPTKEPSAELPIHSFETAAEFEVFLEREHLTLPGFHLKLAKKASGIASISGAEAVEVALCFGWIDGQANGLDENWWTVRYTPRRAKSIWSKKNVTTVGSLVEEGRMRPAGIAAVEAAKLDGRWERAYAGPATITVPADLTAAFASEPAGAAFFAGLNKSDRYSVLWRIETASMQSRAKRIEAMVQMLATGTVPGAASKPPAKAKKATAINKTTKGATKKEKPTGSQVAKASSVPLDTPSASRRPGLRKRPR